LDPKQLAKEMVEAVPLAAFVEWHEEQVRACELGQLLGAVVPFEERVAQRPTQTLEDRAAQHQRL
jgi:hypothetical protein